MESAGWVWKKCAPAITVIVDAVRPGLGQIMMECDDARTLSTSTSTVVRSFNDSRYRCESMRLRSTEWLCQKRTQVKNLYGRAVHFERAGDGGESGEINL